MSSAQIQLWRIYRGEDADIVLTGTDTTDPTGWALVATLSAHKGQSPVTFATTSVAVSGPDDDGKYVLTVSLTRAETSTLTKDVYAFDLWRTDSGFNVRHAGGKLEVLTPVRLPA